MNCSLPSRRAIHALALLLLCSHARCDSDSSSLPASTGTVPTFASVQALVTGGAKPGTWTPAPYSTANGGPAFGLWLLTDGSLLSHGGDLHQWVKLVPDSHGNYANGAWVVLADSHYGRGAAVEQTLKDGRFLEAGGEYIYFFPPGSSANDHNSVEIYNPLTNIWTLVAPGLYGDISDSASVMLQGGRLFTGSSANNGTQIYNPGINKWFPTAPIYGTAAESGWVALPDNSVVAISSYVQARYDLDSNAWTDTGPLPTGVQFGDVGPVSRLMDGRIFVLGDHCTAIYTPGPHPYSPGSWVKGPAIPNGNDVEDVNGCGESNGRVIFPSYPVSQLNEFNPVTNKIITLPLPKAADVPLDFQTLPSGQVIATCGDLDYIWTPVGSPQDAWRPTITSITANSDGSYTLAGTQLSGFTQTGNDDMGLAENFPIVALADSFGHVYYARSSQFSSMTTSAVNESQTAQFSIPSTVPRGSYQVFVTTCGVWSKTSLPLTY